MKNENKNLPRLTRFISWELVVLALLLVSVIGVALRGPLKSFPDLASNGSISQFERDPYDILPDRSANSPRNRVETGL